jgi:hypothetical protein
MVAMVAASVVLAGSAIIYMSALESFFTAGSSSRMVTSRTDVDDLLIRLANQCLPADMAGKIDSLGQPSILTYVRGTRFVPKPWLCRTGGQQKPHEGYPILDDRQPSPNDLAAFGCLTAATMPPPSPFLVSGVIFWYRGNTPTGQSLASRIYHFEIAGSDWVAAGLPGAMAAPVAGRVPYFTGMSTAEIDAFFGLTVATDAADKALRRQACHIIGTQVQFWTITVVNGLNWLVEYDRNAAT